MRTPLILLAVLVGLVLAMLGDEPPVLIAVAAVGLYEMSRRREQNIPISWIDAFGAIRSPGFGAILVLGLMLLAIFLLWLLAANEIYKATLGPAPPVSLPAFARDVFTTSAGWTMIVVGVGVGFLFALLVLVISVVSFPLLLDRDVGLPVLPGLEPEALGEEAPDRAQAGHGRQGDEHPRDPVELAPREETEDHEQHNRNDYQ